IIRRPPRSTQSRSSAASDVYKRQLSASSRAGATIGFHCENGLVIDALVREELDRGHTGAFYHQRTRPPALEREALSRLSTIAELLDAQHYIVHCLLYTSPSPRD